MARLLYAETDALWLLIVAKMYHSTGGVLGVLRVLRACCGPKFVLLIWNCCRPRRPCAGHEGTWATSGALINLRRRGGKLHDVVSQKAGYKSVG